jgi:hypothetical protein
VTTPDPQHDMRLDEVKSCRVTPGIGKSCYIYLVQVKLDCIVHVLADHMFVDCIWKRQGGVLSIWVLVLIKFR